MEISWTSCRLAESKWWKKEISESGLIIKNIGRRTISLGGTYSPIDFRSEIIVPNTIFRLMSNFMKQKATYCLWYKWSNFTQFHVPLLGSLITLTPTCADWTLPKIASLQSKDNLSSKCGDTSVLVFHISRIC